MLQRKRSYQSTENSILPSDGFAKVGTPSSAFTPTTTHVRSLVCTMQRFNIAKSVRFQNDSHTVPLFAYWPT